MTMAARKGVMGSMQRGPTTARVAAAPPAPARAAAPVAARRRRRRGVARGDSRAALLSAPPGAGSLAAVGGRDLPVPARPAGPRLGDAGAVPGPYGTCWNMARQGRSSPASCPGGRARLLGERPGRPHGSRLDYQGYAPSDARHRLLRALGRPGAGARGPVPAPGAFARGPARRRHVQEVLFLPAQPARGQRRPQVGGHAATAPWTPPWPSSRRPSTPGDQRVLLARAAASTTTSLRRLGRRVPGGPLQAPAARRRRLPHQEQLGHGLGQRRLLLGLLLRRALRHARWPSSTASRGAANYDADLPVRRAGLDAEHRVRRRTSAWFAEPVHVRRRAARRRRRASTPRCPARATRSVWRGAVGEVGDGARRRRRHPGGGRLPHGASSTAPARVTAGRDFVVAVALTTPGSYDAGPCRAPDRAARRRAPAAGQSYVSARRGAWTDLTARAGLRRRPTCASRRSWTSPSGRDTRRPRRPLRDAAARPWGRSGSTGR